MVPKIRRVKGSNRGRGVDVVTVTRYKGTRQMLDMMGRGEYIEAFVHAQLAIEKVLWDKIVRLFRGRKQMLVRRKIDASKEITHTRELVKWAYFIGAIEETERKNLKCFNTARNRILHRHGKWWTAKEHREALEKAIGFLKENGF